MMKLNQRTICISSLLFKGKGVRVTGVGFRGFGSGVRVEVQLQEFKLSV